MSDKTIAHAAVEGRKVRFQVTGVDLLLAGYLCGVDDFHWKIVTPDPEPEVLLIHKSMAVVGIPLDGRCLDQEPEHIRDRLTPLISPFRRAMQDRLKRPGETAAS